MNIKQKKTDFYDYKMLPCHEARKCVKLIQKKIEVIIITFMFPDIKVNDIRCGIGLTCEQYIFGHIVSKLICLAECDTLI